MTSSQRARRVEQPRSARRCRRRAASEHRHQRHDARAAGDQQQRPALRRAPRRSSRRSARAARAGRPAELVGRGRATPRRPRAARPSARRGRRRAPSDRVAALGLVAVLGGQPDVDVLAGAMARPAGHVEDERLARAASRRRSRRPSPSCQVSRPSTAAPATDRRSCGSRSSPRSRARRRACSRSPRTHLALFQK